MADPRRRGQDARARGYGQTLVVGLLAATAVTVAVSRPWISATANVDGLPTLTATVSGADVAPVAGALGVVLLAAFGAVVATRGRVRRALGVLIVAAGATVLVAAVAPGGSSDLVQSGLSAKGWSGGAYATDTVLWRWVAEAGAGTCILAGAMVVRFGHRWATMGSRYDAPAAPGVPADAAHGDLSEAELWQAIDRGHDPTQTP